MMSESDCHYFISISTRVTARDAELQSLSQDLNLGLQDLKLETETEITNQYSELENFGVETRYITFITIQGVTNEGLKFVECTFF